MGADWASIHASWMDYLLTCLIVSVISVPSFRGAYWAMDCSISHSVSIPSFKGIYHLIPSLLRDVSGLAQFEHGYWFVNEGPGGALREKVFTNTYWFCIFENIVSSLLICWSFWQIPKQADIICCCLVAWQFVLNETIRSKIAARFSISWNLCSAIPS